MPLHLLFLSWCIPMVFGTQTYFTILTPMNFYSAKAACEAQGTTLATIHSLADLTEAINTVKAAYSPGNFWIGLTDAAVEGTWVWVDGSPADYGFSNGRATFGQIPWGGGEPNNAGGNEDCAHIWVPSRSYYWNDVPCTWTGNRVLCNAGSSAPTQSSSPTESPTVDPTSFPTDIPTSFPTPLPTRTENITNTTEYIEIVTTTPPLFTLPSESEPNLVLDADDDAAFQAGGTQKEEDITGTLFLVGLMTVLLMAIAVCLLYALFCRGRKNPNYNQEQLIFNVQQSAHQQELEMETGAPGMDTNAGDIPGNTDDYDAAAPAHQETKPGLELAEGN